MLGAVRVLLLVAIAAVGARAYSGDIAPMELRLETPLTSFRNPPGSTFKSVLIAPCLLGSQVVLPAGTFVYGSVRHSHAVGIGLLHERATLDLNFDQYELADGRRFAMTGRLQLIENARESVDSHGRIHGPLAANNPQHWLDGLWNRPSMTLIQHSILGLTGMSGRVFSFFDMGPIGGAALIAFRIAMFSLPEPEIQLPPGTEMKVSLTSLPEGSPRFPEVDEFVVEDDLKAWVQEQPFNITKTSGKPSDDRINIAFIGTREEVAHAFYAAGWVEALPRGVRSLSHLWHSFASQTGYADAPASPLLYRGREPDLLFQKSFNTISMRHHVRIWQTDSVNQRIWIGAATHDVGIRFEKASHGFAHRIDPRIDFERSKIVNDLAFAGCADPAGYVDRPGAVQVTQDVRDIQTDGRVAVISLTDCQVGSPMFDLLPTKPARSIFVRSFRRVILETKQYMLRENPYYWVYRAFEWNHMRSRQPAFVDY